MVLMVHWWDNPFHQQSSCMFYHGHIKSDSPNKSDKRQEKKASSLVRKLLTTTTTRRSSSLKWLTTSGAFATIHTCKMSSSLCWQVNRALIHCCKDGETQEPKVICVALCMVEASWKSCSAKQHKPCKMERQIKTESLNCWDLQSHNWASSWPHNKTLLDLLLAW